MGKKGQALFRSAPPYLLLFGFLGWHFLPGRSLSFGCRFRAAPAENFGAFFAAILISFPVWGFLPFLALRCTTENVPKPTRDTFFPLLRLWAMESVMTARALPAAAFEILISSGYLRDDFRLGHSQYLLAICKVSIIIRISGACRPEIQEGRMFRDKYYKKYLNNQGLKYSQMSCGLHLLRNSSIVNKATIRI